MGERTPHLDPHARAALVGLAASHTRAHVVRAILEGVAFSLRDTLTIFDEMSVPVETIRLGGGGARSHLWRQIQADVYGRAVEILAAEEGGGRRARAGALQTLRRGAQGEAQRRRRADRRHAAVALTYRALTSERDVYV